MKTSIQWTEQSINPLRARHRATGKVGHYCEKIAAGCKNCYSSTMQKRFGTPEFGGGQLRHDFELFLDVSKLEEVQRRKKPTHYFWCSMTDIFGDWVRPEWIQACCSTMDATPQHTHILLTKRPQNVRRMLMPFLRDRMGAGQESPDDAWKQGVPLRNVWLLASVSDQASADAMIPELLTCRALVSVLGVSAEPLLEPIDITRLDEHHGLACPGIDCLDWLISGGESGPGARPCDVAWISDIIQQCKAASVPVYCKQLGTVWAKANRSTDSKGGNMSEWREDLRVREMPAASAE